MSKRIALVVPTLDRIGGAEQQVILLAEGLIRRGWILTVVTLSGTGGPAAAALTRQGAGFLSLEMRKGLADPRGWIRFHHWLRREQPDVVHAHLPHAVWLARWSRLGAPVPVVVDTVHTSATGSRGRKLGYRWSNWLPDRVTAVSSAAAEAHASTRMVTADKLMVLSNGVDTEKWRPDQAVREALRSELGFRDQFLWFAAGRLDPVKDYPTLLDAMAGLPEKARLIIAGRGAEESRLRQLSAGLGLGDRVRFLGFEPNVLRWMQAADGFVLSSRWEGLPMALLEAAACAVPAVATDVPGTREVIDDGKTGFLAAAGNRVALEQAMSRMVLMPLAERCAMGERARALAVERFSLDRVLDQWEELYQNLLHQNKIPGRWRRSQV